MMRMMRKMFKRIVSIVMALLVILGTAVYGGSVFAEEQADSGTTSLDSGYIYLNPEGMDLNSESHWCNWTEGQDKVYFGIVQSNYAVREGDYDSTAKLWRWKIENLNLPSSGTVNLFFTYSNDWEGKIKQKPYYRTAEYTMEVSSIGGKVFVQKNVTSSDVIDKQPVYALKELSSYAGKTLSVVDMTGSGIGIKALFSTDGSNFDTDKAIVMTDNKVTIPENGVYPYQYVKFITNDNTELLASTKIEDAINNGSILYYGVRTDSDGIIKSVWSKDKKNSSAPTITKLYFKQTDFPIDEKDSIKVKIGNGIYENVILEDNTILSYDLTGKTLSSDTIIEVEKDNIIYRFYPNRNLSLVTIDSDGNAGLSIYRNNPSGTYTVYYDATLSKLSYEGTNDVKNGGKGIPYPDNAARVYYYATNGTKPITGEMKLDNKEGYPDVYKVNLPDGYDQVRFAAYNVQNEKPSDNGDATDLVTIPGNLMNPCYYGDSSDDVIYKGGNRGGYWDEAYTVRDPEKEAEQHNSKDVVDINEGTFTRNASTLYVNSTFYDYYTDYELNGKNRDDYDSNNPAAGSQRSYVTFRQFDQALSDYYKNKKVSIPIYTGHFQPDYTDSNGNKWGNPFSAIAETLDLYGYNKDNQSGFMSTNNSTLSADGKSTYYDAAAQGLVANALNDENNLMTSDNNALEPHFNEEFLTGNNSKRTALAKVYKNVSFPFTKQKLDDDGNKNEKGVEYWYFDSADTTLAMRTDKKSGSYYLENVVGYRDWAKNVDSSSKPKGDENFGFFPFNETAAACSASNYNYGFGTKLEFKFRLTDDGTVVGTDGGKHPIKFNFSGDDDVWVYVDGNLALDVGGAHGKVTGHINFENKRATVSWTKKSQNESSKEDRNTQSSFKIKGSNSDEHTLTVFYMERGMWESNMKVSFNFPDENEFAVEKKVDTTGVNTELFPTSLFEGASVFPFTIQNQATHYGTKEAQPSDAKQPKIYNNSFSEEKLSKTFSQNTFETIKAMDGQKNVVHWKAKFDDAEGERVNQRFGIIQPAKGDTFDASETNAFLQFKMYYDYPDIPGLASTYLELEDASGNKISGYLSGKTYGNSSLVQKKWNTIQVDLSKLQGDNKTFDYSKIKKIKFNYNFERDIYLDDFIFIPSVVAATKTGFVTQQEDIPDYGSATSGTLEYPEGAQYTLSKNDGPSKLYRIDSDGKFALADGETATFSDQFRRGSYIAVSEDVDSSVFDTTWTLYENGQAVSTMGTGETVKNEEPNPSVQNVKSNAIRDGRKEEYKPDLNGNEISNNGYTITGYAKNQDGNTVNENTIVFRSYADPDNQTTMTKLKATFVNKVKTGKIEIRKKAAEGSGELNGTYTFRVEFSNVAGLSLEPQKIVKEYTIKAGGSVTINGIPAGTDYRISEINSKDGSTLESVIVKNNNTFDAGYDPVTKVVSGKVIASSDMKGDGIGNPDTSSDATIITFNNTLKPTINLNLTKEWKNTEGKGITLPDSIKIRLQRSSDAGKSWETVKYDGTNETITLYQGYDGKWSYPFKDLDQYVNYRADPKVPYIYRVVEVSGDDESETEIESGGYLNDKYKVTYSDNVDCSKISTGTTESFTITNTYSPKTNIKITKQDASNKKLLGGVEFKLEKMKENTSTGKLVVDESFNYQSVTTGDSGSTLGIAEFKDLEDGTYRLTETKTVAGYNLLKDPITIKINRNQENGTTVDGQSYDFNKASDKNTIELQISNRMKFLLPKTGGYGAMLFILCGMALATLCCLIFFLINLRKEVQYSRLKRQRRNAIGK